MSGWLEFYPDIIQCPICQHSIQVYLVEDGDLQRRPMVITSLAGGFAICSYCYAYITDEDLL